MGYRSVKGAAAREAEVFTESPSDYNARVACLAQAATSSPKFLGESMSLPNFLGGSKSSPNILGESPLNRAKPYSLMSRSEKPRSVKPVLPGGTVTTATTPLERTMEVLRDSENLSALELLLQLALFGPVTLQNQALELFLNRNHRESFYYLVILYHHFNRVQQRMILRLSAMLSPAIRRGLMEGDARVQQNARDLIRILPDYDQFPLLVNALSLEPARKQEALELLEYLTQQLLLEAARPADQRSRQDIEAVRRFCLETLRHEFRTGRRAIIDLTIRLYLILAEEGNYGALDILTDTRHPAHTSAVQLLRTDTDPRIMRWVYYLLNQRHPPLAVQKVLSERQDAVFVEEFLDWWNRRNDSQIMATVRQIESIAWLRWDHPLMRTLPRNLNSAVLSLTRCAGIDEAVRLNIIAHFLDEGDDAVRRQAAQMLPAITGKDADHMILACLEDPDLEIELIAMKALKGRGVGKSMSLLRKRLDSPNDRIRQAAQEALSDFNFERYLGTFDKLDDVSRRQVGDIILKIDPHAEEILERDSKSIQANRRKRAAKVIRTLGLTDRMQVTLLEMLNDLDHMVRREAVESMLNSRDPQLVHSLAAILLESSDPRRFGAKEALEYLRREATNAEVREAARSAYDLLVRKG